ncbi:MAG: type II toxin-antitoxin system HicB family antitoxin [Dehalococcoidales bacterium]|nr:type II toxin-antitoxin system HicB family antitoxin [Dehalococcoidales bacterium]
MVTELKRKPVEYYFNLKYPITIIPSEEGGYVAEIEDLPGCLSQGETLEETYANIEESRRLWIDVAYEDGQDIPEPRDKQGYSGNFIVRGPKSLHRKLDQMAKREGVSLNQYLVSTLSHSVGMQEAKKSGTRKHEVSKN